MSQTIQQLESSHRRAPIRESKERNDVTKFRCTKCGHWKIEDDFFVCQLAKSRCRRMSWCKVCQNHRRAERRKALRRLRIVFSFAGPSLTKDPAAVGAIRLSPDQRRRAKAGVSR